jgi:hypothetical protein
MLTYKAMYKFLDEGVHAEVLDFPFEAKVFSLKKL